MAQVSLSFRRNIPAIINPDMTLAVLIDRSGSMTDTFNEGHVNNVALAIWNHVSWAGSGYNLLFYDDHVSASAHITTPFDLGSVIQANRPHGGGTFVMPALQDAISRHQGKKGLYIIVITDGEFSDKAVVQNYVINHLLPKVTPQNPYAFRIHFVGAGEGVDHAFLQQIEAEAAGKGVPVISQHHHAHLSHSHTSILDEMDRALIGVGLAARVGEPQLRDESTGAGFSPDITHVIDQATLRTWDGPAGEFGFLPRKVAVGFEYGHDHSSQLSTDFRFTDPNKNEQELLLLVPLPKDSTASTGAPRKPLFHLPWGQTPEQQTAKEQAAKEREELQRRAVEIHAAEMQRQQQDLVALARGGIPVQAQERLKEIASSSGAEGVIFTSNLDPDEVALLRREGYHPLGVVTGSAMYHVGQAYASNQGDCEIRVLSDAYNTATELAISRLRQELKLIGAHGVVGVRLELIRHEWADKTVEVQAIGTAVRGSGPAPAEPWLCDLAGQEWWALHRAGYDSAGLVWGHATWFIFTTQADEWNVQSWQNVELGHWSTALSSARHLAMNHIKRQAKEIRANGVTGVRVERRIDEVRLTGPGEDPAYEREHHNLVVSIIGTAIRVRPDAPARVPGAVNVLSLRDGRLTPVGMTLEDVKVE
jgi:uncharacterized protein YbjQ (UPF0145 family)